MSRPPLPKGLAAAALGSSLLLFGLACGGLPIGGSAEVTGPGDGEGGGDAADTEEGAGEGEGAVDTGKGEGEGEGEGEGAGEGEGGAPAGGDLPGDALYPALDPNQAPPFASSAIDCPSGLMKIRNPRKTLLVYCATGSGVRSGPYTEWSGKWLVVAGTNVDGKLEGQWTRWERAGDAPRKVEERTYAGGVEQGDVAQWDAEGRLLLRGKMVDGKRHGLFVERKVEGGAVVPGGACYVAGEEQWRTADEAELSSKECAADTADDEAVAEG